MAAFATSLWFVSWGSFAAFLAAGVACGMRRWRLALLLCRAVVIVGLGVVGLLIIVPGLLAEATDPSQRGLVLSQGISEVANCGAPAVLASLLSIVPWAIARRRLRAAAEQQYR